MRSIITYLTCSECGCGYYRSGRPIATRYGTLDAWHCDSATCEGGVTLPDIDLDEDESIDVSTGVLGYVDLDSFTDMELREIARFTPENHAYAAARILARRESEDY